MGAVAPAGGQDRDRDVVDVHGLSITDPEGLETALNQIPGVVSVGLFARRRADVVIVGATAAT